MRRNPLSSCFIEVFMLPFRLLFGVSKSVVRQRLRKSTRHAPREDRKTLVAEQQWTHFVEQYSRLGPDQQIRIWANLSQHQRSYLYTRFRLKSPQRGWSDSCSWLTLTPEGKTLLAVLFIFALVFLIIAISRAS